MKYDVKTRRLCVEWRGTNVSENQRNINTSLLALPSWAFRAISTRLRATSTHGIERCFWTIQSPAYFVYETTIKSLLFPFLWIIMYTLQKSNMHYEFSLHKGQLVEYNLSHLLERQQHIFIAFFSCLIKSLTWNLHVSSTWQYYTTIYILISIVVPLQMCTLK